MSLAMLLFGPIYIHAFNIGLKTETHTPYLYRDPDVLHVTTNEAYNVVKQNRGATEAEYETVPAPRNAPPSTSQPSQPPVGDYEQV